LNIWILSVTAVVALIVTFALGFPVIPALRRLKFGQTILDIGPAWHKDKKQGTPTMGGFMFIIGITAAFSLGVFMLWRAELISFNSIGRLTFFNAVSGFLMALCFGFMGFLDDWIKVCKKRNEGLSVNQKLFMQVFIVAAYFTSRIIAGDANTTINFPLIGSFDFWYFYYVIMGLGIIYIVNAVNITDGVDGLCGSVTVVYCAAFMVICGILKLGELSVLAAATAGACIGFLIWNFNPAKVFMGDTGSLFLGGIVCAIGVGGGKDASTEVVMVIAAAVYIWEALTVLIQTTYFKATGGKRLFKMTPIHHSFELRGFKETKIVGVFSLIGAVFGGIAVLLVILEVV
jgi:phospho-N-acetylmuramoyl-pentapeptide-transferase